MKRLIILLVTGMIAAAAPVQAGYVSANIIVADNNGRLVPDSIRAFFLFDHKTGAAIVNVGSVKMVAADTVPGAPGIPFTYTKSLSTSWTDSAGTWIIQYRVHAGADTLFASDVFNSADVGVDVTAISGDQAAANNLEAALDGTGGVVISADLNGYVQATTYGGFVRNSSFEDDSVGGATAPAGWAIAAGTFTNCKTSATGAGIHGRWSYTVKPAGADTLVLSQSVGRLRPGYYQMSMYSWATTHDLSDYGFLVLDSTGQVGESGFKDSVELPYYPFASKMISKVVKVAGEAEYSIGIVVHGSVLYYDSTNYEFDDVRLDFLGPLYITKVDSVGDSVTLDMSALNAALDNDTTLLGFLRAAIGGTSNWSDAQRDSVLAALMNNHVLKVGDSVITDMSSFNAALDNDTTLVNFLRAALSQTGGGDCGGTGLYAVNIYAIDTSQVDTAVANVKITVTTLAGGSPLWRWTNTSGYKTFNLDSGSYLVRGSLWGYAWAAGDTILVTGNETDTLEGYNTIPLPSAPADSNYCTAWFDFSGVGGSMIKGIEVTATLIKTPNQSIQNTCDDTWIMDYRVGPKRSDVNGRVEMALIKSKCVGSRKYLFDCVNPLTGARQTIIDSMPDSTTYRVKTGSW